MKKRTKSGRVRKAGRMQDSLQVFMRPEELQAIDRIAFSVPYRSRSAWVREVLMAAVEKAEKQQEV